MTSESFVKNYIMHDSLIDKVDVDKFSKSVVMWIDFAFWMQKRYSESDPETGTLKVTFTNVAQYSIPSDADWSAISILETRVEDDGSVLFSLMNDMTDDYLEIRIKSDNVSATPIPSTDN